MVDELQVSILAVRLRGGETGRHNILFVRFHLALVPLLLITGALCAEEPWDEQKLVKPEQLATEMKHSSSDLHVIYVGFPILYKGAHIQGAPLAGPCSKPEELEVLKKETAGLRHEANIVIYCGCCPFVKCPNIRPAFRALKEAGYTNVRVLELDTSLHTDWVEKGYPVEK
jgi:hypothetical protein